MSIMNQRGSNESISKNLFYQSGRERAAIDLEKGPSKLDTIDDKTKTMSSVEEVGSGGTHPDVDDEVRSGGAPKVVEKHNPKLQDLLDRNSEQVEQINRELARRTSTGKRERLRSVKMWESRSDAGVASISGAKTTEDKEKADEQKERERETTRAKDLTGSKETT